MTSNPEPMVQQLQHDVQNLLAYVRGPEARSRTAYTVELTLFRRLLALGAALLRLFFVTRAAVRPAEPVTAPDGTRLASHDQRPTTSDSVFGKVRFQRHYCTAPGQEGCCPLDAELSLPARCDSDLVVQADGTGVPMVQPPPQRPSARLGKGQKRTKQQEAVVTALYTISPYQRTPQEVVAALLQDAGRPEPAVRPRPVDKELQATLAGKAIGMRRLARRVAQREGPHIHQHVALTDGAEALQQQMRTHFPEHTLILDIIHATESRWDTANTLLGETHPQRTAWVRAYLEALLAGQTDAVITALAAEGKDPTCTAAQRQAVRRTVGDYRRNRPYLRDDEYLARGWSMGTGVVEGACDHLVTDRMEQAGMRLTTAGAQAVLDLRAVRLNGHGDAYWPCHRHQQHQRMYGRSVPAPALAEAQALEWAA